MPPITSKRKDTDFLRQQLYVASQLLETLMVGFGTAGYNQHELYDEGNEQENEEEEVISDSVWASLK